MFDATYPSTLAWACALSWWWRWMWPRIVKVQLVVTFMFTFCGRLQCNKGEISTVASSSFVYVFARLCIPKLRSAPFPVRTREDKDYTFQFDGNVLETNACKKNFDDFYAKIVCRKDTSAWSKILHKATENWVLLRVPGHHPFLESNPGFIQNSLQRHAPLYPMHY